MQPTAGDDFFDNMLSSWPDPPNPNSTWHSSQSSTYDRPPFLTSQFRQHHLTGAGTSPAIPQLNHSQQQLLPSPTKSHTVTGGNVFDAYGQSVSNRQQFNQGGSMAPQSFGGSSTAISAPSAGAAAPRQRVRARRGQATDPHSIAERLRREKISERMKALQELVPNANKTDKASMLDEIIDYVKFLQLQTKVLSMSRLGGAAAVAPLVADMSSEGHCGTNRAADSDNLTTMENQVAKLMEDDMGSAMQYLQGKGLCLMPISLASAISTATSRPSPSLFPLVPNSRVNVAGDIAPSSPNMSVLTVQSTMSNGANADADVSRSTYRKNG